MSFSCPAPSGPIESIAQVPGAIVHLDEPMSKHVSMGVGGPARGFVVADDADCLEAVHRILVQSGLRWVVLGGGSNTIVSDEGYDGVVLSLGRGFRRIEEGPAGPSQITAGAAAQLSAIMNFARRRGLAGMEWAAGVPGVLGGALAGNAGTGPGDMCSMVESVDVIDPNGNRIRRPRGGFAYAYRRSDLSRDLILGATLAVRPDNPAAIKTRQDAGMAKRLEQPIGKRCSGCMFKNPPGEAAGRLIDRAGLKGLRMGGAEVSGEHANFVINDGSATARDILELIDTVRRRVCEKSGVNLDLEIRVINP